jgi:hypothetical protein
MKNTSIALAAVGVLSLLACTPAKAQIIITEVDPSGSSNTTYKQDWFELTNYGPSSVSLTGWKMDDNSNSFSDAVSLKGISSISANQSVVFLEDTGSSSDATLDSTFETAWFGSQVPTGFTIGNYGGSGVGLGTSGDAVNIFDSTGVLQAGVQFAGSTEKDNYSYDNSVAKITNTGSTDGTIATLSAVGVDGAFKNAAGEIGSPGAVWRQKMGAHA